MIAPSILFSVQDAKYFFISMNQRTTIYYFILQS